MKQEIIQSMLDIGQRAYNGCIQRGFADSLEDDHKALLLMHSEISEAVEYFAP